MDKTESHKGVESRSGKIRISFHLKDGTRRREPLNLADTPKNKRYAEKLRAEIVEKIHFDIFVYSDYFPDSKYAQASQSQQKTVAQAAQEWLHIIAPEISAGTLQEYRNALTRHFVAKLGEKMFAALTYTELKMHMASLNLSPKTYNNVSVPIRALLRYAYKAGYTKQDFATEVNGVKNRSVAAPDPLTADEVESVLGYMSAHYPETVANYFEFELFAGLRPSEMIALSWPDIDMRSGTARIQRAQVRGKLKEPKTGYARDVELHDRAIAALMRQRKHAFMQGAQVFHNPITGQPYYDTDVQVRVYWRPALKALGIRDRAARQARHTCATMMLMAGCNPAWAAAQLGHSKEMFFRVYSRWIDGADKGAERRKFNATAPSPPQVKDILF